MSIRRWRIDADDDTIYEDVDPRGRWVLHADHMADVTELVRALRDIRMSNAGTEQRKRGWDTAYELLDRPEYKEIANGK